MRNLKDFSQIFSGFGIGIAAIHSLSELTPMLSDRFEARCQQPPQASTSDEDDDGPRVGLVDLLTWLGERKKLIGAVTLAAALVSVAWRCCCPIYTARATLLAPGSQQQSGSAAALAALGSLGGLAGGWRRSRPTSSTSRC